MDWNTSELERHDAREAIAASKYEKARKHVEEAIDRGDYDEELAEAFQPSDQAKLMRIFARAESGRDFWHQVNIAFRCESKDAEAALESFIDGKVRRLLGWD